MGYRMKIQEHKMRARCVFSQVDLGSDNESVRSCSQKSQNLRNRSVSNSRIIYDKIANETLNNQKS